MTKRVRAEAINEHEDDSDAERERREDERGRTILAAVGKAIQDGTKIPLEWDPITKIPCGDHKDTFSTYVGVIARERISISHHTWKNVPKETRDGVFDLIKKGFIVLEERKAWIMKQADNRWRAFKTRLRLKWMYHKQSGRLRISAPTWKYPWITQKIWDAFVKWSTSDDFKILSEKGRSRSKQKTSSYRGGRLGYQYYRDEIAKEFLRKGIHIDHVPRHETWLRAHAQVKDGKYTFSNPIDEMTATAINELKAQAERGEVVFHSRRDDILARALKKPERGGHVRGVGSGITNKQYFGYNRPTPPSHMLAQLTSMQSNIAMIQNQQNVFMSCMMSILNPEQLKQMNQFQTAVGGGFLGIVNNQHGQFTDHANDHFGGINFQSHITGVNSHSTVQATCSSALEQKKNLFTHLLSGDTNGQIRQVVSSPDFYQEIQPSFQHQEQDVPQQASPYHVPWPIEDNDIPYNHQQQVQSPQHNSTIPWSEIDDKFHINDLPEGLHDCCLGIEDNNDIKIVATGQVYIPGKNLVVKNHLCDVSTENRRVSIIDDIDPTALLPCPIQDFIYVFEAKETFVPWPTHLIFQRKKLVQAKEDTPCLQSSPSQASFQKEYIINDADRAKVNSGLLEAFMSKAMELRKKDEKIMLTIPNSVFNNEMDVRLDFSEMLDWCFEKEVGISHMLIFMNYLSEVCQKESVAGMYGFCDVNFVSPLSTTIEEEIRSEYLCNTFGCNGGKNINQLFFAPFYEKGLTKFSVIDRKDIKKLKKSPGIAWITPQCPRQPIEYKASGYYVCRYMLETIESRGQVVPPKYYPRVPTTYSEEMIDEIRNIWITYVLKQKQVNCYKCGVN